MKDVSARCVNIGFKSSLVNRSKFKTSHNENQYNEINDDSDQGTTIHESNIKMFIDGLTIVVTVAGSKNTTFLLPSSCKLRIWNCHPLLQFRLLTGDIVIQ
jgi:hypothetical protein